MNCMWCLMQEATHDMYCEQCNEALDEGDKAAINRTFMAARWRVAKEVEDLKHAVKASLPPWLRRLL